MEIIFSIRIADLENQLKIKEHLPEFVAKVLRAKLSDKVEGNARTIIGSGFGGELAEGVRTEISDTSVMVDHKSNDTNHLAQHVHEGGPIRAKNTKFLAIPLHGGKEYASDHRWKTKDGKPIFLHRKKGPGWVMFDESGRGKNKKLVPLFVLVSETAAQKPRPWWPSEEDFKTLTEYEITSWAEKVLPESI